MAASDPLLPLILAELQALRREVAELRAERERAPATGAEPLVRVIADFVGARAFTAKELVEHSELPAAAELRAAIVAGIGSANPRKLGKLLRAIEGRAFCGLSVRGVGSDRDGRIWCIASLRV